MFFVVVGTEEAVMAWVVVGAMVLASTARVLWHPCTMNSGKQDFLSLSKALFSGHVLFWALLLFAVHSK